MQTAKQNNDKHTGEITFSGVNDASLMIVEIVNNLRADLESWREKYQESERERISLAQQLSDERKLRHSWQDKAIYLQTQLSNGKRSIKRNVQ